jgi:hypothetical protein
MTRQVMESMIAFPDGSSLTAPAGRTLVPMTSTSTSTSTSPTVTEIVDAHLEAYALADVERRRALVEAAWHPDGRLIDPPFDGAGHDGIVALADAVVTHYPGHTFRRTTEIDAHHDSARYGWALVAADGTVAVAGTDVVDLAPDGRLLRVVGFFGDPVALA